MFEKFYENKRVLVTGADGFMGSHLTEKLLDLGAEVSVFVRYVSGKTGYNLKNISHLENRVNIIAGDISSQDSINLIKQNDPEIIFHLAALAYVNFSFEHPMEVMKANLGGTLNVLEAARSLNVKHIVITSSSEVYGPAQTETIDENHPLNPTSPYAASKAAADRYAFSYWKTYGLPISIIRPFNTYGPRHTYDVIPKFIRMVLEGKPPTIYGTGEQSRDFTYVSDMIRAFLFMGSSKNAIGEVVNFGTGKDVKIKDLAYKIIHITGSDLKPIYVETRKAEVDRLCCNYGKAKKLFGWEPKISLDEGLKLNIEWCRENWFRKRF
jgi:dTDP-glucose 4,6-dehydratase